jgi:hypothetical protein
MKEFGEPSFIKSKFRQVSGFESFPAEISFLIHHRNCSIPWVGDCIVCGNTQFQDGKYFVDYPTVTTGSDIAINVSCHPFKLTIVIPMNLITFTPFNSCGMMVRKLMGSHRKSVTDF